MYVCMYMKQKQKQKKRKKKMPTLRVIDERNTAVASALRLERLRREEIPRIPPPVTGSMEPIHTNLGVNPEAVVRQVLRARAKQERQFNRMTPFPDDACGISEHDEQTHQLPSVEDVDQFRRWELAQVAETQRQIRAEETEQLNYYL